jgi:hypothetical protein
MRARSRFRSIGADVFQTQAAPSCPAGQHYEPDTSSTTIKGMGKCVPNLVAIKPLTFRPAPAAAPAPLPPAAPVTFQQPAPTQPTGGDFATAPQAPIAPPCPPVWPWWWLLVAFGVGAGGAYYIQKNQKKAKKNLGRVANEMGGRIVNGASNAALSRMFG